jgi:hypothetical protein
MTRTEAHVSINDVATTTTKQFNDLSDIVQKSRDSLLKGNKLFVRNEITEALNNSTQAIDAGKKECELIFNSAREYVRSIEDLAYLFDQGEIAEVLSDYFSKALVELSKTEALVELYLVDVDKKMIIFINLDYTVDKRAVSKTHNLGLQEGFKEKQLRYRGLKTDGVVAKEFKKTIVVRTFDPEFDPVTGKFIRWVRDSQPRQNREIIYMTSRVYGLLGGQYKDKKYVEISIHHTSLKDYRAMDPITQNKYESVDQSPDLFFKDDVIDDLKGLDTAADKCKLIISGHGDSEADSIQSDAEHDMAGLTRYNLNIEGFADFLKNNINKFSQPNTFSIDRPLPISLMCCQSAGLKAFENRNEAEISMSNTMAGKLLTSLANGPQPIYAKVKARTTNVASVKSSPRADVVEAKNLSADSLDDPSKQVTKTIVGTSQVRRGLGGVDEEGTKLYAFYKDTLKDTSTRNNRKVLKNAYGVGYGVQGKDFRVKGYKYAFYYVYENGVPKFKAVDLSDKSDVDPIFEVNKDRLIQYVYGLAYYVYEQHDGLTQHRGMITDRFVGSKVREKKNAILKYLYDIELANNRGEIVNILTRMTNDRAITANLNWYGFGETRTVKLINILKGEFTGPQKGLLRLANLDNKNLGLV